MRLLPGVIMGLALASRAAAAGLLSAGSVAVLDGNSNARTTFTNNERITFQQRVFNGVVGTGRITFTFNVLSPTGGSVFQIAGNSAPGSVGNAATQLSGFPISKFYAGPGVYTLQAMAELDGQTITQQATFVISSPNIILLYPPNGAQDVADVPLTFRWISSGGSTYKVTVGDNPSFYNSLFTQDAQGAETSLTYPVNPPDSRQKLSAGQIYYWKVEAFDANGLQVGSSAAPYSFTVQTSALSRDMAVTDLVVAGAADAAGNLPFKMTVKNQGGAAQSNVSLRFSVGGIPAPGTPVSMMMLGAGDAREYAFSAPMIAGLNQNLAIACIEFSDDNLGNNCKTLMVNQAASGGGTADFGGNPTAEQVWRSIQLLLAQQGMDLSDYDLVGMEGQLSADELKGLLDQIRAGLADVSLSGPKTGAPATSAGTTAAAAASRRLSSDGAAPVAAAQNVEFAPVGNDWSGLSAPLGPKASGVLIGEEKVWRKVWKQVSSERVPEVDFEQHMVVGIFAGKGETRDHAEIEAVEMSLSGLVVRYKFVNYATFNVNKPPRPTVPYRLRIIPRTVVPVSFDQVVDHDDAFEKKRPKEKK
ncbi:MAG: hypothetical protein HYZ74_03945 [Elusimicrobia bacterium]|nr:hypothetical protein [Elusimicrobiota bacterium]